MANDTILYQEIKQNFSINSGTSWDDDDDEKEHPTSLTSMLCSANDQPVTSVNNMKIFDDVKLNKSYDEWLELNVELRIFECKYKECIRKLDEVELLKTNYRIKYDKYKKKS
ncbi:unnamed protein product [Rotaria magnacalcarata]